MNTENKIFYLKNENGKEIKCELLFTFELKSTGKNYMVFTEYEIDDEGNTTAVVYSFDPRGGSRKLQCVDSEYELQMAQYMLEKHIAVKYN